MPDQEKKTETPKTITDITQILNSVQRQKVSYASSYWVPSLEKEVRFSEINTSQQKRLIKSIVDSPVYNTEFIHTFYDILKENIVEPEIDVDKFTIIDKLLVALGLRINCVGSLIDIQLKTKPDAEPDSITVDLSQLYEKMKKTLSNIEPSEFKGKMFNITCNVPTIELENRLETELRKSNDSIEIQTNDDLRNTIGEAFIDEIVKYVAGVEMVSDDVVTPIDWDKFSIKDRISVVGTFGTDLLKHIVSYINIVKTETNKIEIVKLVKDGVEHDRRLTIDGSFFTISSD